MTLLFTVFVMLNGQPHPVVMDTVDLGEVTVEQCRERGEATATALMGLHPMCQAGGCFTLLRCKGEPEEAGSAI